MSQLPPATVIPRIIRANEGEVLPAEGNVRDRFLLASRLTGGGFSLVEHLFEPRALAAPFHRHSREDEYTFVLQGRIGASVEGVEIEAGPGDLILKPRSQWHTFWNAGDSQARVLEVIAPGGLEILFRTLDGTGEIDPEVMARLAAAYGCEVDFERTLPLVERHRLVF